MASVSSSLLCEPLELALARRALATQEAVGVERHTHTDDHVVVAHRTVDDTDGVWHQSWAITGSLAQDCTIPEVPIEDSALVA